MISANGGLPAHRYTPQVTPRWPRGSEPASVPCGFLCWCGPFSPCRCARHSPCGFRWLVGVRSCDPYGVRCLLRRCVLGGAPPGVVRRLVGVGRRWSPRRGMSFLGVGRGVCRGALFLRALVPAPAPSWILRGFLPPCGVSSGALSLWVPALTWVPSVYSCLSAPSCHLPSPCPCPSPSWCGGGGRGGVGRGRRWPRPGGGWPGAIGGGLGRCRRSGGPRPHHGGGPPMPLAA